MCAWLLLWTFPVVYFVVCQMKKGASSSVANNSFCLSPPLPFVFLISSIVFFQFDPILLLLLFRLNNLHYLIYIWSTYLIYTLLISTTFIFTWYIFNKHLIRLKYVYLIQIWYMYQGNIIGVFGLVYMVKVYITNSHHYNLW